MTDTGPMSRRMFLRSSAALAAVAATPQAVVRGMHSLAPARLVRSRFVPALGTTFRVSGGSVDLRLVLTEINDLSPVLRADDEDRFSLIFEAPLGRRALDGIRTLRNERIGVVDLFVSRVERPIGAQRYQAVINRSTAT